MNLPDEFQKRMSELLGKEYPAFIQTYKEPRTSGLRINPIKVEEREFQKLFPSPLDTVPFCPTGFYYEADRYSPGKHPYHQAGLYYIQEPSAMFVAETLDPKPGETVLDLCAAPGGKSTQVAGLMNNEGLLISNEIHPKRAKALSENIERLGITNTLVTNEAPNRLAKAFEHFFDRILVDAPCSGEGMFRKDPEAASYWSVDHVKECAQLQGNILESAYTMLKGRGTLVYSTCTFAPEENEQSIEGFMKRHPDMELISIEKRGGIASGRPEWTSSKQADFEKSARLWPHLLKGEGHFVAKLRKTSDTSAWHGKLFVPKTQRNDLKNYYSFEKEVLRKKVHGLLEINRGHLFALPEGSPDLSGLKVVRPGLHVGEFKKNRFEPNHALALGLKSSDVKATHELMVKSDEGDQWPTGDRWNEAMKYLKGETLQTGQDRGWILVIVNGFPLGWGKEAKGILKNFYPKGLRIQGA